LRSGSGRGSIVAGFWFSSFDDSVVVGFWFGSFDDSVVVGFWFGSFEFRFSCRQRGTAIIGSGQVQVQVEVCGLGRGLVLVDVLNEEVEFWSRSVGYYDSFPGRGWFN
jgi:hypothetical protein